MTALMLSTVLLLTIVLAMVLGVAMGWVVCNAILQAMAQRPERPVAPPLTSAAAGSGH